MWTWPRTARNVGKCGARTLRPIRCCEMRVGFGGWNPVGQLQRAGQGSGLALCKICRYADPGYFQFWRPVMDAAVVADRVLEEMNPGWGRLYFTAMFRKETA